MATYPRNAHGRRGGTGGDAVRLPTRTQISRCCTPTYVVGSKSKYFILHWITRLLFSISAMPVPEFHAIPKPCVFYRFQNSIDLIMFRTYCIVTRTKSSILATFDEVDLYHAGPSSLRAICLIVYCNVEMRCATKTDHGTLNALHERSPEPSRTPHVRRKHGKSPARTALKSNSIVFKAIKVTHRWSFLAK